MKRVAEGRGLYEFSICHKGAVLTVVARREQVEKWIDNKEFAGAVDVVDHEAASEYLISTISKRHTAQIYVAQAGEVDVTEAITSVISSFNKDSALTAEEFYGYLASVHGKERFPEIKEVVLNIMDPDMIDTTSFKDKDVIVLID